LILSLYSHEYLKIGRVSKIYLHKPVLFILKHNKYNTFNMTTVVRNSTLLPCLTWLAVFR
jgi:hypothetical protein